MKTLLPALLAGAALFVAGAAHASQNPPNLKQAITFSVKVKTSFGTTFTDCFSFNGAGQLVIAGLSSTPLTYETDGLGASGNKFGAVTPLALAESLGEAFEFHGLGLGKGTQNVGYIHASGLDENGDQYVVNGPAVASCTADGVSNTGGATPIQPGQNWFKP